MSVLTRILVAAHKIRRKGKTVDVKAYYRRSPAGRSNHSPFSLRRSYERSSIVNKRTFELKPVTAHMSKKQKDVFNAADKSLRRLNDASASGKVLDGNLQNIKHAKSMRAAIYGNKLIYPTQPKRLRRRVKK